MQKRLVLFALLLTSCRTVYHPAPASTPPSSQRNSTPSTNIIYVVGNNHPIIPVKKDVTSEEAEQAICKTTKQLNEVEESLNYWGKIAMSEPVFIENSGQFKINFDQSVTNYLQAAQNNVSEASRSALETSLYLGSALQAEVAPPVSLGSAGSNSTNGSQATVPNQAESALTNFTPLLTLGTLAAAIDERQAVEKAINDKIAEQLLEFMANPNVMSNKNQKIIFGVMQVTCQPGQTTKQGYLADLNVSVNYGRAADSNAPSYNVDDGIEMSQFLSPGVFAVLPLTDSRNIQTQSSDRSQLELASALSAAFAAKGVDAAAKGLADYVHRRESDSEDRDSVPVVTTYTDGSTFGFQIYPSFQADLGKAGPKATLKPITFPAIVAIIIDREDYYDETNADEIKTDHQGNPWNYLITESETRWIPIKKPGFFSHGPSLNEWIKRAKDIDAVSTSLDLIAAQKTNFPNQYEQLKIAYDSLSTTALGFKSERLLPDNLFTNNPDPDKDGGGNISDIFPHSLWRDSDTTFTILLKGITDQAEILGVNIAGKNCQTTTFYPYSNGIAINATLPVSTYNNTSVSNSLDFVILTKKQPLTKTLAVVLQGKLSPEAMATITRDSSGKISSIDVKPGQDAKESQLLDATKEILEKSEELPKTTTIVH